MLCGDDHGEKHAFCEAGHAGAVAGVASDSHGILHSFHGVYAAHVNPFAAAGYGGAHEFLDESGEFECGVATDKKALHFIPWEPGAVGSGHVPFPSAFAAVLQNEGGRDIPLRQLSVPTLEELDRRIVVERDIRRGHKDWVCLRLRDAIQHFEVFFLIKSRVGIVIRRPYGGVVAGFHAARAEEVPHDPLVSRRQFVPACELVIAILGVGYEEVHAFC